METIWKRICTYGLPWWLGRERICVLCSRLRFIPWVGTIAWWMDWQTTPVFLPGKFHGWRILVGYRPEDHKELDTTEWLNWTELRVYPHSLLFIFMWLSYFITVAKWTKSSYGFQGFSCVPGSSCQEREEPQIILLLISGTSWKIYSLNIRLLSNLINNLKWLISFPKLLFCFYWSICDIKY